MMKAVLACLMLMVGLAACQPTGGDLPPVGEELMAIQKARCEAKGDIWGTTGGKAGGGFACLERTGDANKSCTRSTDCEGQCLARSGTCAVASNAITTYTFQFASRATFTR